MLLKNCAWDFDGRIFHNPAEFDQIMKEYTNDLIESEIEGFQWNPDEIIINVPRIRIEFPSRIHNEQDLLPNEQLLYESGPSDKSISRGGLSSVTVVFDLISDNGMNFSALELLLKLQNQQANKPFHYFFEGIEQSKKEGDIPTYIVCVGT